MSKPYRSDKLLAFVRTLPCSVPGCSRKSDAAHIGPHGMKQKASDACAVPLCDPHHKELGGRGGRRAFETRYNISLLAIADRIALRPFIYIENANFVGRCEGEHYVLGPVSMPPKIAAKRMINLRRERLMESAA